MTDKQDPRLRWFQYRLRSLLVLVLLVSVGMSLVAVVSPQWRYLGRSRRISKKIDALSQRRPATVSPRLWEESVGWALTAHGNICFSEQHTTYEAMCRFEEELDEKLEGQINIGTIEWIWHRLGETGPHGQRYIAYWTSEWEAL